VLITGIGLLIILYAAYYLQHDDPAGKFFSLLMLFMAAMLGIVLSDNLLLLVVFWELTSISSFLLVGYWGTPAERARRRPHGAGRHRRRRAGDAGRRRGAGADRRHLRARPCWRGARHAGHALYPLALLLILVGCFTKSAQCRSTSGCPRRWPRPRRCRPTCTRPPWSRPASSC
jgi:multicomponent K+:H+ antiporter subunit A